MYNPGCGTYSTFSMRVCAHGCVFKRAVCSCGALCAELANMANVCGARCDKTLQPNSWKHFLAWGGKRLKGVASWLRLIWNAPTGSPGGNAFLRAPQAKLPPELHRLQRIVWPLEWHRTTGPGEYTGSVISVSVFYYKIKKKNKTTDESDKLYLHIDYSCDFLIYLKKYIYFFKK